MSFSVWTQPPPFAESSLSTGEHIYQVGAVYVITDQGPPTQAQIDAALGVDPASQTNAARLAAIDSAIAAFSFGGQTLTQLKAMDNAAFDAWWTASVTNLAQANAVLKFLARAALRKLV